MDSFDEYYAGCNAVAQAIVAETKDATKFCDDLFQKNDPSFAELLTFRSQFVDERDTLKQSVYLEFGHFSAPVESDRIACLCVYDDIMEAVSLMTYERRFAPYARTQPIFIGMPELWELIRESGSSGDLDHELIQVSSLARAKGSEIVSLNGCFATFDYSLNPLIVDWAEQNFTKEKIYVRIDPYSFSATKPTGRLHEAILQPANPNWWRELNIHLRAHEGCAYILDGFDPRVDHVRAKEKAIKKVERLEVKANRGNDGLLSLMMEEVSRIDQQGVMVNRVVHMDTDAPFGTPFESAQLKHLDIAIYVYVKQNATQRNSTFINEGIRAPEADYKCHLLRVDDLPFSSIFGFAQFFMNSKSLLGEWIEDQFEGNAPALPGS